MNEGTGQVVLTVNRSGGSAGAVTVDYAIAGGSATAPPGVGADFGGPLPTGSLTGTLQFGPNVMSQTITIPIVNDSEVEPERDVRSDAPESPRAAPLSRAPASLR